MAKCRVDVTLQALFEKFTGYRIERVGRRSVAALRLARPTDGWFSLSFRLRHIFKSRAIDLVLDVGANEGQFARQIREFYSGEILSFEPVSSTFVRLAAACAADPKWHAHNVALGSEKSSAAIHVSDASVYNSLLTANEYSRQRLGQSAAQRTTETVRIRRGSDVLNEYVPDLHQRRIFLKMDTQGYDARVFAGFGSTIEHVLGLLSEVSLIPIYEGMPPWTETMSAYERAGFGVSGLFPVTWDRDRLVEYDCLMLRRS
jgi:FkbM family methyltransferase